MAGKLKDVDILGRAPKNWRFAPRVLTREENRERAEAERKSIELNHSHAAEFLRITGLQYKAVFDTKYTVLSYISGEGRRDYLDPIALEREIATRRISEGKCSDPTLDFPPRSLADETERIWGKKARRLANLLISGK